MLLKSVVNQTPVKSPRRQVNWDTVLRVSDFQNLINVIYHGIIGIEKDASKACIDGFFQKYKRSLLLKKAYKNAEEVLIWQLERHRIQALFLAGTKAYNYYSREEFYYEDRIEILVNKESMGTIHTFMTEMDYEKQEDRLENGQIYVRVPGVQVIFYDRVPLRNRILQKYFSDPVKRYIRFPCYKYIHLFSQEEEYIYRAGRLVEKYMQGELKVRHFADWWQFREKFGKELAWPDISKVIEKAKLAEFVEQTENLVSLWFGQEGVIEGKEVSALEEYVLSGGKENRWLDSVILPYDKVRLDFYRRNREKEWGEKVRSWWFPPREYMTQLFPVLEKFPFLLVFFWMKRGLRFLKTICSEKIRNFCFRIIQKWRERGRIKDEEHEN